MENHYDSAAPRTDVLLSLPGIRITSRSLTIADRHYPVAELRDLRTLRGRYDPMTTRAGLGAAIGLALLGATGSSLPPIGLLGAAGSVGLLAIISAISAWRRPRGYALWAEHHGVTLQLYYSDDERIFGHVCRSLRRARERAFDAAIPNAPHYGRHLQVPSTPYPGRSLAEQARDVFTRAG